MSVGVEHQVGDPFRKVHVGDILEHARMFLPTEFKRGERLCGDPALAIHPGGGNAGLHRLELEAAHVVLTPRMPEFAHRHVGMFVELKDIAGDHVAHGGFVADRKPSGATEFCHASEKMANCQIVDGGTPVAQEKLGSLGVGHDVARQRGQPPPQRIAAELPELRFHVAGPCLPAAFPTVEQHAFEQTLVERPAIGCQASDVAGEMRLGTSGGEFVAFPSGGLGRGWAVAAARIHMP